MQNDALTAGVRPDGIKNRRELRILICFLIFNATEPLAAEDLIDLICDQQLANYFEACDAISSLITKKNIKEDTDTGLLTLTDDGLEVAKNLYDTLPITVREKAETALKKLIFRKHSERENKVEIKKLDTGCNVSCTVMSAGLELMSISLYVPDEHTARLVKERFLDAPATIYRLALSQLTGTAFSSPTDSQ
ncbi:MAG: DUF4364 family protein [Ruminococcaceae bacterium]|nr:DUF4364 family protein [Oscillospiraceae bacterium]